MGQFSTIYIVLKIAEVCNLGCKHCYFFEGGDRSYLQDPSFVPTSIIEATGRFLERGIRDLNVETIEISLHGGEPLMLGKRRFAQLCETLLAHVQPLAKLRFLIQTNATLLDDEWVDILDRFNVGIGISLDGPAHVNDRLRIDKKGRGSYADVIKGIETLRKGKPHWGNQGFGVGCVIQPDSDAREIYDHLVHVLGLESVAFRPPIMDWTTFDSTVVEKVTRYYQDLVSEWIRDNDPRVRINFPSFVMAAMASDLGASSTGRALSNRARTFTIRSDGDLCPDDSLVPKHNSYRATGFNVARSTLRDFFAAPFWVQIERPSQPHEDCRQCRWLGICRGGPPEERYTGNLQYSSKTVYCETRKAVFEIIYDCVSSAVGRAPVDRRLEELKKDDSARASGAMTPDLDAGQRAVTTGPGSF